MWNGGSWSQVSYLSAGWHQSDQGPRGTVMVPWRTEWSTKVTVNSSNIGQKNTHFTSGPDPLKTNRWGLACLGPLWLFWGGDWLSKSVVFPQGCLLWKRGAGSPAGVQLLWCDQSLEITPWSGGFYPQLILEQRECEQVFVVSVTLRNDHCSLIILHLAWWDMCFTYPTSAVLHPHPYVIIQDRVREADREPQPYCIY